MSATPSRKPRAPGPLCTSARALLESLQTGGKTAIAIRERFHRTMLWRWTTGRGVPDRASAQELHILSRGRVRKDGWAAERKRGAEPAADTLELEAPDADTAA